MSIIHSKFRYRNKTNEDFNLIIGSFNSNSGESDTFLSMEDVSDPLTDGRLHYDYGASYSNVAQIIIELMMPEGQDISPATTRAILAWLTGSRTTSWLEMIQADGTTEYSFRGRFVDAQLYKMDGRVIGVVAMFKAVSPWAYSNLVSQSVNVDGSATLTVNNLTDDLYSYVYPDIVFANTTGTDLTIASDRDDNECELHNLLQNETIILKSNQIVVSDVSETPFIILDVSEIPNYLFDSHRNVGRNGGFNYKWIKLYPGINTLTVTGTGNFQIGFRYPMKVADGVTDLANNVRDCSRGGNGS